MTRFRLSRLLAAALLACAFVAGGARAEQMSITGQAGSPLTTTDGAHSVTGTTTQTFSGGLTVGGSGGAAVITLGPLPTGCAGLPDGSIYNNGGVPAICAGTPMLTADDGSTVLTADDGATALTAL